MAVVPRQRLGVALLIPPPVGTEVDVLRRAVGDDDVGRMPPHITLVPPVNVREDELDRAVDVLQAAAATVRPLRLELGPTTTFLPTSPTLFLSVSGDVDGVQRLRDAVFVPPLARRISFEFVPHVTLLDTGEPSHLTACVDALAGWQAEVVVGNVHLMREQRRPSDNARVWVPIADATLGRGAAVVGRGGLELELETSEVLPPDAATWIVDRWHDFDVERFGSVLPAEIPVAVVARRDGEVVAAATGEVRPSTGEAYLAQLIVRADARSEGVGAHVVAAFASAAAERDATHLTLRTDADGRSRGFYERLGFREAYRLPQWRNGRDFVQLRRDL